MENIKGLTTIMNDEILVQDPTIEVVELVCQNTPDFTHGNRIYGM